MTTNKLTNPKSNPLQCFMETKNFPIIIKGGLPLVWIKHSTDLHHHKQGDEWTTGRHLTSSAAVIIWK